jgi:outer membrane protein assembly factor BamB
MWTVVAALLSALTVSTDWAQWRGPARDGRSAELNLLKEWPSAGPRVVWRLDGLGPGYSSPAIVGDSAYTMGQRGEKEYVVAVDVRSGRKTWETAVGEAFRHLQSGDGPRSTPTIDGDRLYALSADGALTSLETATGAVVWSRHFVRTYGGSLNLYGFSESPLIDGDRLIVMPGGPGTSVVSLNKRTAALNWKAGSDHSGYASTLIVEVGGVRQVLAMTGDALVSVEVDTGEVLWRYATVSACAPAAATPIYKDGHVFVSTGFAGGCCALLRLGPRTMSEVYVNRDMRNVYSSAVLVDDVLYGFNDSVLTAMDFLTGKVLWRDRSVGKGSITYADGRLYVLGEEGEMALVRAAPQRYIEVSRFNAGGSAARTPPVIANGLLFLRIQDRLTCYDIRGR